MAALGVTFLRHPYGALGLWGTQKSAVCILFHAEKVFLILETVFCVYYYVHNGNRKFYHGRFKDNLLLETIVSIPNGDKSCVRYMPYNCNITNTFVEFHPFNIGIVY